MKKAIIVLVLIALLAYGVFVFLNINNSDTTCQPGFRFVPSTQTCEPIDQDPADEQKIDFAKVTIQIPDTSIRVQLQKNGDTTQYSNTYKDATVTWAVSLDSQAAVDYSTGLVLVPFTVNSGGTGQFVYIGLFDKENNAHLSSAFIGDRVNIDSLAVSGEKVKVNFKTRLDSESFAATPTISAQVVLEMRSQKLVEIMRLQNSDFADIEIKSPMLPITSTGVLDVKGAVPGFWYFEAIAQFTLVSEKGEQLAIGTITALSEWMTTQRVPFELKISNIQYKGKATLIIHSENVQGEDEGARLVKKMAIPVEFK